MKIRYFIALFVISCTFLCSCNTQKESTVTNDGNQTAYSNEMVASSSDETETPAISAASPNASTDVNESTAKTYANAYYNIIKDLIEQYGFYDEYDEFGWQYDMGLVRGELIDFEEDGIPELVCLYKKEMFHNIRIYHYSNNQAELLVDELTGDYLLGDNCSDIYFTKIDGKPYILTQNCDWGRIERIKVFTLDIEELQTIEFYADANVIDETYPQVEQYLNCVINGKSVSEEEYIDQKEYYYQDTQNKIYWRYIKDDDGYHDYEQADAVEFIKSLAADAGISETEVDDVLS